MYYEKFSIKLLICNILTSVQYFSYHMRTMRGFKCFPTCADFGDWPRRQSADAASSWKRLPVVREGGVRTAQVQ